MSGTSILVIAAFIGIVAVSLFTFIQAEKYIDRRRMEKRNKRNE
tara:strand:- start:202 stop:333 length:132 start_codon:yes stop_codon:yes gene_type:complete